MRIKSKLAVITGTKHVADQRGTPYSVCVSGAKELLEDKSGS